MIEPSNIKSSISLMCVYGKGTIQIQTTSDVESDPSLQIQFTYMIGFSNYINRLLTITITT